MTDLGPGIIYAVAEILRLRGDRDMAEQILGAAGITDDDYEQAADYDLEPLREAGFTTVTTNN